MRLRAGDAGDLLGVEHDALSHRTIPAASRMPRAHDCTECAASTRSRSRRPSAARSSGLAPASAPIRSASARGSCRGKAPLRVEERVEDRVRGQHRQTRGRGLVDDLVRRARAHVVDERVAAPRAARGSRLAAPRPRARRGPRARARRRARSSSPRCARSSSESAGPWTRSSNVLRARGERGEDDVEALRRRVAAEREEAQACRPRARRSTGNSDEVDPVPDRAHLRRRGAGTSGGRRSSPRSRPSRPPRAAGSPSSA